MWDVWVHRVKAFPHYHVAVPSDAQEHFPGVLPEDRLLTGKNIFVTVTIGGAFLGTEVCPAPLLGDHLSKNFDNARANVEALARVTPAGN